MTTTKYDYRKRVKKGAALLDERRPGWWRRVKFADLEMSYGPACVVGQVFSDRFYSEGLAELGLTISRGGDRAHGFNIAPTADQSAWDALGDLWMEEVRTRRRASRGSA